MHWLRRLVFRGAWLDQRVMEGELEIVFDDETHTFGYAQPDRGFELIELSPEPSWKRVAYRPLGGCARQPPIRGRRCSTAAHHLEHALGVVGDLEHLQVLRR